MSDPTIEKLSCARCNKEEKVTRIIRGGSGMIFKGSGFYLTDYTKYGKKDTQPKKQKKESVNKDNNNKKNKEE